MIPQYPSAGPLTMEVVDELGGRLSGQEPYSDFDLGSLWAWDDGSTLVASLDGGILIRFPGYEPEDNQEWGVAGSVAVSSIESLLNDGTIGELVHVPEPLAQDLSRSCVLDVQHQRDDDDYVLRLEDYLAAMGGQYSQVRRRRHQAAAAGHAYRVFNDLVEVSPILEDLDERWLADRPAQEASGRREQLARRRLTAAAARFGVIACVAYTADGNPVGYNLGGPANQAGWATAHFAKAVENANAGLCEVQARFLLDAGYEWLNIEQDIGLPGLREFKSRQCPGRMLQKYRVRFDPMGAGSGGDEPLDGGPARSGASGASEPRE